MKYDLIHLTELLKTEELMGNMSEELNTAKQKWLGFMTGIKTELKHDIKWWVTSAILAMKQSDNLEVEGFCFSFDHPCHPPIHPSSQTYSA